MSLAGLNRTCAPPEITHHSAFLTCAFCLDRVHPETPGQFPRPARFLFGKEAFFVLARKELALLRDKLRTSSPAEGRVCAEAYKNSTLREVSRSVIEPAEASAATAEISTLSLTCLCPEAWRSHRPRAEKDLFRTETN